jgi:hypothetical protein
MDDQTIATPHIGDDVALLAVLTAEPSKAAALAQLLTRQLLPHDLLLFHDVPALRAHVEEREANGVRTIDSILVDLVEFPSAPLRLTGLPGRPAPLIAAFSAASAEEAARSAASHAKALLLSGTLTDRDSVTRFVEALVDHWFGEAPSLLH